MEEVIKKINAAKNVAILTHINEDPDTLGSCFAFKKMMIKLGKKATVIVSAKIEERLSFMGNDYIQYSEDMDLSGFDLCACIDCGDKDRLGERKKVFDAIGNSINIDHHFTNTAYADANYIDGDAAAAAQILTEMFEKAGYEIDHEIAYDLYTAICSDTGCFKFSSVSPATMRMTANLLEYDFDHAEIARLLFDTETIGATLLKAEISQRIKSYAGGKVTLVTADERDGEKYGIVPEDIPNLVDIPRRIAGTEIAVCIKKTSKGYRVNLRSNGKADVAAVAGVFNGGGHVKAAGAVLQTDTMEEAVKAVIAECEKAVEKI